MFLDFAKEVLKVKKQSLTVEEIWNFGNELKFTNLINEMKKMSKTPISKLSIILINDIQNNPDSNFISDVNYQKFSLHQHLMDNIPKNLIKNEQYLAQQVNNIEKENITKILNEKESKNMDNSNNNIFLCLANRVIKIKGKPLTAQEIWDVGNELKVTNAINNTHLKDMSPILRIAIALNTDIVNNPHSNFIWYRESGKFALKNESNITERLEPIDKTSKAKALENTNDECCAKQLEEDGNIKLDKARNHSVFNERDLHSVVVKFLHNSAFNISSKTIFHELSSKKVSGKNKWLHPDIVGVHFPFNDFSKKTLKLQKEYLGSLKTKFYSFELKKELSFANLRESYFQAVSNSSWANEGYLVTLKISESNDFINELKRLNDAFNIGVIKLNPNNIKQSIILFPAKEKETLDWATIDRLVTENSDFKDFVRIVIQSLQANTIVGNFDKVLTDAEYENYINEKHIKE